MKVDVALGKVQKVLPFKLLIHLVCMAYKLSLMNVFFLISLTHQIVDHGPDMHTEMAHFSYSNARFEKENMLPGHRHFQIVKGTIEATHKDLRQSMIEMEKKGKKKKVMTLLLQRVGFLFLFYLFSGIQSTNQVMIICWWCLLSNFVAFLLLIRLLIYVVVTLMIFKKEHIGCRFPKQIWR